MMKLKDLKKKNEKKKKTKKRKGLLNNLIVLICEKFSL